MSISLPLSSYQGINPSAIYRNAQSSPSRKGAASTYRNKDGDVVEISREAYDLLAQEKAREKKTVILETMGKARPFHGMRYCQGPSPKAVLFLPLARSKIKIGSLSIRTDGPLDTSTPL